MYQYLDKLLAETKKKIRREFNRIGTMGFDRLNVINGGKITTGVFQRLLAENAAVLAAMRDAGDSGNQSVNVYLDSRQITASVEQRQHERGRTIMGKQAQAY